METVDNGMLSGLYTIRAGMTIISQQKDYIDGIIDTAKKARAEKLAVIRATEETAQRNVATAQATYEKAQQIEEDNLAVANYKPDKAFTRLAGFRGLFIFLILACVVALVYVVGGWLMYAGMGKTLSQKIFATLYGFIWNVGGTGYSQSFTDKFLQPVLKGKDTLFLVIMIAATLLPVLLAVVFGLIARRLRRKMAQNNENFTRRKKARAMKRDLAAQTKKVGDVYNKQLAILEKIQEEAPKRKQEIDQACMAECQKCMPRLAAAVAVLRSMNNLYAPILDMKEWDNLDIITNLLEKRKATTMSDALEQLSEVKGTEKISPMSKLANADVARSIAAGLPRFKKEFKQNLTSLVQQIQRNAQALAEQQQQHMNVGEMNGYIQQLTNLNYINTALLTNANKQSSTLAAMSVPLYGGMKYVSERLNSN